MVEGVGLLSRPKKVKPCVVVAGSSDVVRIGAAVVTISGSVVNGAPVTGLRLTADSDGLNLGSFLGLLNLILSFAFGASSVISLISSSLITGRNLFGPFLLNKFALGDCVVVGAVVVVVVVV